MLVTQLVLGSVRARVGAASSHSMVRVSWKAFPQGRGRAGVGAFQLTGQGFQQRLGEQHGFGVVGGTHPFRYDLQKTYAGTGESAAVDGLCPRVIVNVHCPENAGPPSRYPESEPPQQVADYYVSVGPLKSYVGLPIAL